ncbi:MAG TPA: hypothetical protein VGF61_01355 [Candidatus Acidoferrum sp.]|jgi:hypothetical protein
MSVVVPVIVGMAISMVMRMNVHGHIVRGCAPERSLRGAPVSGKYDNTLLRIR